MAIIESTEQKMLLLNVPHHSNVNTRTQQGILAEILVSRDPGIYRRIA
jgi:hypothetical protein